MHLLLMGWWMVGVGTAVAMTGYYRIVTPCYCCPCRARCTAAIAFSGYMARWSTHRPLLRYVHGSIIAWFHTPCCDKQVNDASVAKHIWSTRTR